MIYITSSHEVLFKELELVSLCNDPLPNTANLY